MTICTRVWTGLVIIFSHSGHPGQHGAHGFRLVSDACAIINKIL